MPLLGILIIFNSGIYLSDVPFEFKRMVYAIVLLCTLVLPLTILPALYFFRMINEITIDERRQRLIPLFFSAICFYMAYYLVGRFSSVQLVNSFLFAGVVVVMVILFISLVWKISIHMAGIGGIVALIGILSVGFTIDMTFFLCTAILLAGIIGTARLALNTHSFLQVLSGFLVGLLLVCGLMLNTIY